MSERSANALEAVVRCPSVAELDAFLESLARPSESAGQGERIDRIAALERLKNAASAAQARETVAFRMRRVAEDNDAGVPVRRQAQGVGSEVALARRESPNRGSRLVGLAVALVQEMPNTMAALTSGVLSEWRATLLVRETACLTLEHRREVDARMAERLASLSDSALVAEARRHAYALDPVAFLNRGKNAESDRHVSCRPAPDTMSRVSALLPCVQGVAVMAALRRAADAARAAGDPRSRGQVMADTLVERVTGQTAAEQTPVEVHLAITDLALFGGGTEPGWLHGYGPVPAPYARMLLRDLDDRTRAWIRRFITDPVTGLLVAVDPKRRVMDGVLRRALIFRDLYCRTPWCGAPIRHSDHVIAVEDGGETSEANGQGLCEACNYAKQGTGWRSTPAAQGAGHAVTVTTPTGHTYVSRPPPAFGDHPPPDDASAAPGSRSSRPGEHVIEIYLRNPYAIEYAA